MADDNNKTIRNIIWLTVWTVCVVVITGLMVTTTLWSDDYKVISSINNSDVVVKYDDEYTVLQNYLEYYDNDTALFVKYRDIRMKERCRCDDVSLMVYLMATLIENNYQELNYGFKQEILKRGMLVQLHNEEYVNGEYIYNYTNDMSKVSFVTKYPFYDTNNDKNYYRLSADYSQNEDLSLNLYDVRLYLETAVVTNIEDGINIDWQLREIDYVNNTISINLTDDFV